MVHAFIDPATEHTVYLVTSRLGKGNRPEYIDVNLSQVVDHVRRLTDALGIPLSEVGEPIDESGGLFEEETPDDLRIQRNLDGASLSIEALLHDQVVTISCSQEAPLCRVISTLRDQDISWLPQMSMEVFIRDFYVRSFQEGGIDPSGSQ